MTNTSFEHNGWICHETTERDVDHFTTRAWEAHRNGVTRMINHSRFDFEMTQERFEWLVVNNFPQPHGPGPWTSMEIDAKIAYAMLQ